MQHRGGAPHARNFQSTAINLRKGKPVLIKHQTEKLNNLDDNADNNIP
jgi:hypothetical protein